MNHLSRLCASAAVTHLLCGAAFAGESPESPPQDFFYNYAGIAHDRRLFSADSVAFPPAPKSSEPPTAAEVETFLRGEFGSPEWVEAFGRLFYSEGELPVAAPAEGDESERWTTLLQLREIASGLKPVELAYRPFARYVVGSNVVIPNGLGGNASSDNVPRPIPEWLKLEGDGLQMIARPGDRTVASGDTLGSSLYVVNPTDTPIRFTVADSSLFINSEGFAPDGEWRTIDVTPDYWCGNSYHQVELDAHSAWKITVPTFASGPETRVRYRMSLAGDKLLLSNEVTMKVPPELLLPPPSKEEREAMMSKPVPGRPANDVIFEME